MSNIIMYNSTSIIDSFLNDIYNISNTNKNKYLVFIDWNNTMVEYKSDGNVILRNNNGYAYEIYNKFISDSNNKGFYIISKNEEPENIQNYMEIFSINTETILNKNNIKYKNDEKDNLIYNFNLGYILSAVNPNIKYHQIIDEFLKDNYNNLMPIIKKNLLIIIITADIYNLIDVLLFSKHNFNMYYFPTNIDEKLFIEKYGLSENYNVTMSNIINYPIKELRKLWNPRLYS